MFRYAVVAVLWVMSLAMTSVLARQAPTPPPTPQRPAEEWAYNVNSLIKGEDIAFRVSAAQTRWKTGSDVVVGTLMIRRNGVWVEATLDLVPRLVPAN